MKPTRIAGPSYDQRHADQVEQVASIHHYVTRIRALAARAARDAIARLRVNPSETPAGARRVRPELAAHGRTHVAGSHRILPD